MFFFLYLILPFFLYVLVIQQYLKSFHLLKYAVKYFLQRGILRVVCKDFLTEAVLNFSCTHIVSLFLFICQFTGVEKSLSLPPPSPPRKTVCVYNFSTTYPVLQLVLFCIKHSAPKENVKYKILTHREN